ncbi:hypothetical protein J6W34_02095 [bacterium]|nr:hypothetical protein [bacterium]
MKVNKITKAIPLITLGIAIEIFEMLNTNLLYPFQFDHIPKHTITAKITLVGTTIDATIKLAVNECVKAGFENKVK